MLTAFLRSGVNSISLNRDTVSSEQLGHLGLVAATIRDVKRQLELLVGDN
jgi:hypothetical protein